MSTLSVKIQDKRKRIRILDADDAVIGEIAFNPDDSRIYRRLLALMELLTGGKKEIEGIEFDEGELEKELETAEDFAAAAETIAKLSRATEIAGVTWDEVCAGLDELFGQGVTYAFTGGAADPELLLPLFDCVMPLFAEARKAKTEKYSKDKGR